MRVKAVTAMVTFIYFTASVDAADPGVFFQSVKELGDGYAFRFKAESQLILEAAEFIVYERLCCPFFDFELAIEQDSNRLWLRLRGQEGIKEFIRSEFKISED